MVTKTLTSKDDTFNGSNNDDIIYGLEGNDSIFGSNGDDEIYGGKGDDLLRAGGGNDTLVGGTGDDVLTMYTGHEVLDGGGGIDFIDFYWASRGVRIDLDESRAQYVIGSRTFRVDYKSIEAVYGSAKNDRVIGDDGDNVLRGEDGDDKVSGGKGDDFISAGNGRDTLSGGSGKDSFIFGYEPDGTKNVDQLEDFDAKDDRIGFNVTVFALNLTGNVSHFRDIDMRAIDTDQFQSGAGKDARNADVRVIYDSANGILYYDGDGSDPDAPEQIAVLGKHLALTADSIFGYGF